MNKTLFSLLLLLVAQSLSAQAPQLTVNGKTNNGVVLQNLKIEIKVCGTIAKTSWQMVFKNNTDKILEGTLNFPLKEGCSVSRYALDINGKMREAVPVDRGKGTMVFEAIERRGVDPGLLEKVEGNTFRTRIYPINAHSTRTVIIGYEEELSMVKNNLLNYYLPLGLRDTIADFSLHVQVVQTTTAPFFDNLSANEALHFDQQNKMYTADLHKINYTPSQSLSFSIPKPVDAADVVLQEFENKYYYLINTSVEKKERLKPLPQNITLLWDASLSGANRNSKAEMNLLQAYFASVKNAALTLVIFSNKIYSNKKYSLQNGNWDELKKTIDTIRYDGATNLDCLRLDKMPGDEFLLVSDGHQTFGSNTIEPGNRPVYCINSAARADYSSLQFIAQKSGGAVIDLQKEDLTMALNKLTTEPFRFLGIQQNTLVEESYPSMPVIVGNSFSVAGIATREIKEMVLQFGYGKTVSLTKKIIIDADRQLVDNFDITKVFAQKKITELDVLYDENKNAIEALGKRFGIVTRNTSLIVLETVNDYLQYQIEPPAELLPEYNRIIKQRGREITTKEKDNLQTSLSMMAQLKGWWNTIPKKIVPVVKKPIVERRQKAPGVNQVKATPPVVVNDEELQEVVVVGYATQKKMDVTGSVTRVSADEINEVRDMVASSNVLQGRVPGLSVTGTSGNVGANNSVMLRGMASTTNTAPLYVIDGIVSNGVNVKPEDIEHVEVLTANAASAIYGARGTSGVVVITTKNKSTTLYDSLVLTSNALDTIAIPTNEAPADYIKMIRLTERDSRYNKYLELRRFYLGNPVYFFEVAECFYKTGDKENGQRILSNLAEMETGSYELYKMLGYKLKETGDYAGEVIAFKKVLELRPLDPQSFRDYALALEDAGDYQGALDQLYAGMTNSYSEAMEGIYAGIEEIFLFEINRLIAGHPKKLSARKVPKAMIQTMPVDLRVVMNWNMNNTDIDLWVTDPTGEKCMYSHKTTEMGGRISDDFTDGLGPEQFILKNAKKGKYRIEINYYGDRQATIAGPTTVMAEIYLHYGMPNEERRIITLQMEKGKSGAVFIGEVTL